MPDARTEAMALLDNPQELWNFFWSRAQERDRAQRTAGTPRERSGAAKTTGEATAHKGTPTESNRGQGATPKKKKRKPFTIRYLTVEEVRALKSKTEDDAPEGQTTTEAGSNLRPTGKPLDKEDKTGPGRQKSQIRPCQPR